MKILAQETIAFQGKEFFNALIQVTSALQDACKSKGYSYEYWAGDEAQKLSDVIEKFTHLNIKMIRAEYGLWNVAAIYNPFIRDGHIFQASRGRFNAVSNDDSHVRKLFGPNKNGTMEGSVDIRQNKVTGFFTKIPYELIIGQDFVHTDRYSPRELAALILHEIGHAFTNCEYVSRTLMANQVLATIASEMDRSPKKPISVVMLDAVNGKKITPEQYAAVEKSQSLEQCIVFAYADANERCVRDLGASLYDSTTWEQLADQYANRCGAGRDLVTALPKFHENAGYRDVRSKTTRLVGAAFYVLLMSAYIGAIGFAAGGPAMGIVLGALTTVGLVYQFFEFSKAKLMWIYDEPADRFKRIRSDIIAQLKDEEVPEEQVKVVLVELDEIEKIIDETLKYNYGNKTHELGHYLAMFFSNVYRQRFKSETLQKQLEQLASNPLFVQAAKLRTA